MIFGAFDTTDAEGVLLAHTLRRGERKWVKGRRLDAADVAALLACGIVRVKGARLAADDIDEDAAAAAELFVGDGIMARAPVAGRCNLHAEHDGLLTVDAGCVERLNALDENLSLATLAPFSTVRRGQRIATVKVMPFAVAPAAVARWCGERGAAAPLCVLPFVPRRTALVLAADGEKATGAMRAAMRERLARYGCGIDVDIPCAHETVAMSKAIRAAVRDCGLILVAGATVSKDRRDVMPAALVAAGGRVERFGMPVEPGNMMVFGELDGVPVVGLPGCVRSLRHNGIDMVLGRLMAGRAVGGREIVGMGAGGLLRSAESDAEEGGGPRVAALILAAGRAQRMGENKLLCELAGKPMLLHAVDAALASRCAQAMVVSGSDADRVEAAVAGRAVSLVHCRDHEEGMAASLRTGLRALPPDIDAAIVMLGDMPRVRAEHLDGLIAAFAASPVAIVAPMAGGRRGNPVLWPRRHFADLLALRGDRGGRELLLQYAEEIATIDFDDDAVLVDVDTPEALRQAGAP